MAKDSLVMTPTYHVAGCIISILGGAYVFMRWCTYLLTYLHSWLCAYKTGYISETVEDGAKFTINGLYKIVHGLSIAAKMYDLD